MENLTRDANDLVVLHTTVQLGSQMPVVMPDPTIKLPRDFMLTQIVVVSTTAFYWKLTTNVNIDVSPYIPASGWSNDIYGAALAGTCPSLPLTIRDRCRQGTSIVFGFNPNILPSPSTGVAEVQLMGYYVTNSNVLENSPI